MSAKQSLVRSEAYSRKQRELMGDAKYEEWVHSQHIYQYTPFTDWNELKRILEQAGYDLTETTTRNGRYIKTHIGSGEYDYFYWLDNYGTFIASFSIYNSKFQMHNFMVKVEDVVKSQCFFDSLTELSQAQKQQQYTEILPTVFTQSSIVLEVLKELNIKYSKLSEEITFNYEGLNLTLKLNDNNIYDFIIKGNNNNLGYELHQLLESKYNKRSQVLVCEQIKSNVAKQGSMNILKEETLDDDSIVITISV